MEYESDLKLMNSLQNKTFQQETSSELMFS